MLRAVIYARCSTEEESQKHALLKQVSEAEECVCRMGWELMDTYVESRSGTSTKGRTEYKRLFEELSENKFDIIVIKSQDRLVRNTRDWYLFVDRMVKAGKQLYMYMEQKFYSADDALITGIKAILAEEYSRELSKKINNAHYHRQKNGGAIILTSNTYGYRRMPDKSIAVIEEEAQIKRRMYELCAAGYGGRAISAILADEGVRNRKGNPFSDADILRMIKNPLNKGTVVMNRKHYDFDLKKTVTVPVKEQYVYENKVPAIVSEELWEQANLEILKRKQAANGSGSCSEGRNQGKSPLSKKLYCGLCRSPYYRCAKRRGRDEDKIYEWKCRRYLERGRHSDQRPENQQGCDNVHLDEEKLLSILGRYCMKEYNLDKKPVIQKLQKLLEQVLRDVDTQAMADQEKQKRLNVEQQMLQITDKLLEGVLSDAAYQMKQRELEEKLREIQNRIIRLDREQKMYAAEGNRISRIENILSADSRFERAAAEAMMEFIDQIYVYPEHMEIISGDASRRLNYGVLFDYPGQKRLEREEVIRMMKENPNITVKQLAEKLGLSVSGAGYRIRILKEEGRVKYRKTGNRGKWETD
ncbi:recombinase family protein [Ruminococcus sp. OA3]|uniref:recombinase family protein n=1 Tax=Ruminococcus sp. OA3 TaxID=2914164 RepID=UPI001F05BDC4|nr:recombinase family protein [Ruminococcus sp. OA3]MCH1983188.1 recombinase family protein [Ruminococcus sp. OA3]